MRYTMFRAFVNDLWFQHKKEVLTWDGEVVKYTVKDWFVKNKWFIKRLYKEKKHDS